MALGDRFYRKARDKVEVRTGEQVELISMASRTGRDERIRRGQARLSRSRYARGRGTAFTDANQRWRQRWPPANDLHGRSYPTAFRVFKFRRSWFGLKITKELGALPRQGLRLETNDAGMVKHVHLAGADGSAMSFEMNRVGYTTRFADRLITALSQSS